MKTIGVERIISMMAICALLIGSAPGISKGSEINSSDFQPLQKDSPLKSISPKTFILKDIRDMRGLGNANLVYRYRSGNKMIELNLDKPVAAVIQKAVRDELERNGHKCLPDSPGAKPDFKIAGSVLRFDIFEKDSNELTGFISIKLTIFKGSEKLTIFTNKYDGGYHQDISTDKDRTKQELQVVNKTLLEVLGKMSTDPKLIEYLSK